MQAVDFTTLHAVCAELRAGWLPARAEQVVQRDRHTLALALRTLRGRDWLTICWHPQAARMHLGDAPPKGPDTFTFSDQLRHQLNGLALVELAAIAPWERVVDLRFATRPGEAVAWHLYVEIVGKYSNVVLANAEGEIVAPAHQVGADQSRLRPVLTGQPYEPPPALTGAVPDLAESFADWKDRVALIPGKLYRQLLQSYRGIGPTLARRMCAAAGIDPNRSTQALSDAEWERLGDRWREWLQRLRDEQFDPGWTADGYTVLGWQAIAAEPSVQTLLERYYRLERDRQRFGQLRQQLLQRVGSTLEKARQKVALFEARLRQADDADTYRQRADLLMAYLHEWEPGARSLSLPDFETGEPVAIPLDADKTAVQNAQALYKRHQKLKRARGAVEPLLAAARREVDYLDEVATAVERLDAFRDRADLQALQEIREELIQQGYLRASQERRSGADSEAAPPLQFRSPGGFDVLVGRNNRQNDTLSFRTAVDYDLWFHAQEIPGSHVLLRLDPGASPDPDDLQFAADLAAYHSRARESDRVPVVYTNPKYVLKPKGALPGTAIYSHEQVLWGSPDRWRETN